MLWTIFVAVLLLFTTVDAFGPGVTARFDMAADDCQNTDLTDCTLESEEANCPVSCGWGSRNQIWNRNGQPFNCKASCCKDPCDNEHPVIVKVNYDDIYYGSFVDIVQYYIIDAILVEYPGAEIEVIILTVTPCRPPKGVGFMFYQLKVIITINGDRHVRHYIICLQCCCERHQGGTGPGVGPVNSCFEIQVIMGPPHWSGCFWWKWPPGMARGIEDFHQGANF